MTIKKNIKEMLGVLVGVVIGLAIGLPLGLGMATTHKEMAEMVIDEFHNGDDNSDPNTNCVDDVCY